MHCLFVCSRNRWRSPTAERIFAAWPGLSVRSRGLSTAARRRLAPSDLAWADVIFVMEDEHHERLLAQHAAALGRTPVFVLDVPDEYEFMDTELVEIFKTAIPPLLAGLPASE